MHMHRAHVEDWIQGQRRRKWRLAGRAAQAKDERWSKLVLDFEIDVSHRGRGRPKTRWEDELIVFVARTHGLAKWAEVTAKAEVWRSLEAAFLKDKRGVSVASQLRAACALGALTLSRVVTCCRDNEDIYLSIYLCLASSGSSPALGGVFVGHLYFASSGSIPSVAYFLDT